MPNLIVGNDGSNTLPGTAGTDVIYGWNPNGPQSQASAILANRVATGFNQPLYAVAPPGDTSRLFIVEKTGQIKILDLTTGQVLATPFLDVSSEVETVSECGLLGLAFDPDFATNGIFYVTLTTPALPTPGGQIHTEIRSYQVSSSDPNVANPASENLILSVPQPFGNHKGGWLAFGPDGYLYVALGDGGSSGDPLDNAQNLDSLLGKILRLDVHSGDDFPGDPAKNYAIPPDNPFAGATAGADEIFALGLRNPWRDSFDRALGDFYIADVGQGGWEEIDIGAIGANYGWNVFEGPQRTLEPNPPSVEPVTAPVYYYDHSVGQSITGGYVYRGEGEALHGQYFFADFVQGKVFTLRFDGTSWVATDRTSQIVTTAGAVNLPSSFGEDARGNLYLVDFDGDIFRLTPMVASGDQADVLRGLGGDDMLFGGSGNDTLDGGAGADMLFGGPGTDTADYSSSPAGVSVSLVTGLGAGGDAQGDILGGIENIIGSAFSDLLTGNGGANTFLGGAGADTLTGGTGTDTADYSSSPAGVSVSLETGSGAGGDAQGDSLGGIENLVGSAQNDALTGNGGANTLAGGPGGDTLAGGAGTDTADYSSSPSGVNVSLQTGSGAGGHAQGDMLDSIENLVGSAHNDTLTGNGGVNSLLGGGGNDALAGGGGDDMLTGGAGNDSVDGGAGTDSAVFSGIRWAYHLSPLSGNAVRVVGPDGTDTVTNVERLAFSDQVVTWRLAGWVVAATGDFNGDGTTDLLWQNAAGDTREWLMAMNGGVLAMPATPGAAGWNLIATADFNGDGTTDLLWKHASAGVTSEWLMSKNGGVAGYPGTPGAAGWDLVATADFNGDGIKDLLWQHASGVTSEWIMSPNGGVASFPSTPSAQAWKLAASGDFNGDGATDLMWQHTTTGATSDWLMSKNGGLAANPATPGAAGWEVAASGDFNGDGTTDLLWTNPSAPNTAEWLMAGGVASILSTPPTQGWSVVASGDFNADGTTDLMWVNPSAPYNSEWLMSEGGGLTNLLTVSTQGWFLVASGDFNGDGTTDLMWKNASSGNTSEWLMNGGLASNPSTPGAAGWEVVAAEDFSGDGITDILWQHASGATSEWIMAPDGGVGSFPGTPIAAAGASGDLLIA